MKLKDIVGKKIAVKLETQEKWDSLLEEATRQGLTWGYSHTPADFRYLWGRSECSSCISFYNGTAGYATGHYYSTRGDVLIELEDIDEFKDNKKDVLSHVVTWQEAMDIMSTGGICTVTHYEGTENESTYHMKCDEYDEFRAFNINSGEFLNQYLDSDDIHEGIWRKYQPDKTTVLSYSDKFEVIVSTYYSPFTVGEIVSRGWLLQEFPNILYGWNGEIDDLNKKIGSAMFKKHDKINVSSDAVEKVGRNLFEKYESCKLINTSGYVVNHVSNGDFTGQSFSWELPLGYVENHIIKEDLTKMKLSKQLLKQLGVKNVWFNDLKQSVTVELTDGRKGTSKTYGADNHDVQVGFFVAYGYAKSMPTLYQDSDLTSKSKVKQAIDMLYEDETRKVNNEKVEQKRKQLEKQMEKELIKYRKSL